MQPPQHSTSNSVTRRAFLASSGTALATQSVLAKPAEQQRPRKKLIGWGTDLAYPFKVQGNIRKIEELPFDGIVLSNFKGRKDGKDFTFDWECFGKRKFARRHIADTVNLLKNIRFKRFTDNFLRFNVQPGNFDWFDDFSVPLHNVALWAKVARDVGVKGWKFDVEDYKEKLFIYPKQKHAKTKSFAEYAAQIRRRGQQVMAAIQKANPKIVLLLSLAHSYVNRDRGARHKLSKMVYGLLPAFVNGLIDVAGPQVRLIDGQEQAYGYLKTADYYRGYHNVRQRSLEIVPRDLWQRYRQKMEVGVAIFANYQLAVPRSEAQGRHWPATYLSANERLKLFEQNVYSALATTDEYVWLYSELMGWWESGYPLPTPQGSLAALKRGRDKYLADQPLGFDMTGAVHRAVAQMKKATGK